MEDSSVTTKVWEARSVRLGYCTVMGSILESAVGIVIFDGECVLCNRIIARIARADRHAKLAFTSRRSPPGAKLLAEAGASELAEGALVFISSAGVQAKSAAVFAICAALGFPYSLVAFLGKLVPCALSDKVYEWVARVRIRWFGRADECALIPADVRARLLKE